jgi:hypothetical protein
MMQVVPNSGIFNDPGLDSLRSTAIALQAELPEDVVYYLRALEGRLLELTYRSKQQAIRDIGWTFKKAGDDAR